MTTPESRLAQLNIAIQRGGGILAFARALGVTHQAVTAWRKAGCVPFARAFQIDKLYSVPAASIMPPENAGDYLEAEANRAAADVL